MSGDPVERKEIPPFVGQIVEQAIDRIYGMLLLNDPDRQRAAALIRSYIDGKYFSTPEAFLANHLGSTAANIASTILKGEIDPEALRTVVRGQVSFARTQTVNVVDSVLKGEADLETVSQRAKSLLNVMADLFPPTTPKAWKSHTKRGILDLYDEYCGRRGLTKAEFIRYLIKLNNMAAPKGERRGIKGIDVKNLRRCLDEWLKERRSTAE